MDKTPAKMDRTTLESVCEMLADTNKGLTGSQIIKICKNAAITYNVFIPVEDTHFAEQGIPNKRTALFMNLDVFSFDQQMAIINELSWHQELQANGVGEEVRRFLEKRYRKLESTDIAVAFGQDADALLDKLPKSRDAYKTLVRMVKNGQHDRQILDESRFVLEQLLQELLNNSSSLENNLRSLGSSLKQAGISSELRNMVTTLVSLFAKYQNNHVKHHDSASQNDYQFIVGFTLVTIRFLVATLGGQDAAQ